MKELSIIDFKMFINFKNLKIFKCILKELERILLFIKIKYLYQII